MLVDLLGHDLALGDNRRGGDCGSRQAKLTRGVALLGKTIG
jgi:hypothetical protein